MERLTQLQEIRQLQIQGRLLLDALAYIGEMERNSLSSLEFLPDGHIELNLNEGSTTIINKATKGLNLNDEERLDYIGKLIKIVEDILRDKKVK
jgi:hypothetical protein